VGALNKLASVLRKAPEAAAAAPPPAAYAPAYEAVRIYELPRARSVYHTTNEPAPVISSKAERLVPDSLSATTRPDYVWGDKAFRIRIPAGTRVGELDNIFSLLPPEVEDTPLNIGKLLRKYADEQSLDALRINNVPQIGKEWVIINPELLKAAEKR